MHRPSLSQSRSFTQSHTMTRKEGVKLNERDGELKVYERDRESERECKRERESERECKRGPGKMLS